MTQTIARATFRMEPSRNLSNFNTIQLWLARYFVPSGNLDLDFTASDIARPQYAGVQPSISKSRGRMVVSRHYQVIMILSSQVDQRGFGK